LRRRLVAFAAASSAVTAVLCLAAVQRGGGLPAGLALALALAAAAVALAAARQGPAGPDALRVGATGRVVARLGGGRSVELSPVCVVAPMICLAPAGGGPVACVLWRDATSADGFRRLAALGRWRRGAQQVPTPAGSAELIARDAVTGRWMAPRPGWPRPE
jgi:hypothetical protein